MTRTIAIIPARGGSKRIPRKNLLPLAGLPLIAHTIRHAQASDHVESIYVSTDDPEIAAVARSFGAEVIDRPPELSGDAATSESALLHVLDERNRRGLDDPELVVFLQATSPVHAPGDIDAAIDQLLAEGADSIFSGYPNHRLFWEVRDGRPQTLNWDVSQRQRSQDMEGQWLETGAIFVFRPEVLRSTGNRFGGKIAIYPMGFWSTFELDDEDDARLLEWVLTTVYPREGPRWPERLELVVFDFDGVMTDNAALVDEHGRESVRVSRADGWGIARLRDAGMPMLVLSTEENAVVAARCAKLGLECVQGVRDKASALADLLAERAIDAARVAFVGNDVNDLGCLELVGFPVAVADAHPDLLARAVLVLPRDGGDGAVRAFCDLALARLER